MTMRRNIRQFRPLDGTASFIAADYQLCRLHRARFAPVRRRLTDLISKRVFDAAVPGTKPCGAAACGAWTSNRRH
jgi:hypothetical protein